MIEAWHERELDIPLVIIEAPFRDIDRPLLDEVRAQTNRGDTVVTVVLPELVPRHWWENLLHNQTAFASSGCCCSSRGSWSDERALPPAGARARSPTRHLTGAP